MRKLILLLFMLFLCGCANHAEIEETAIVVGAAVDEKDGQIELTVETVNTVDAKEGSAKGGVFSCKADSVSKASAKMATVTGKPLYWDHLKLIVISEDALNLYLDELLEWLLRSSHSRIDTPLAVSDTEAKELLLLKSEGNNFISDTLMDLIDASYQNGYTVKAPAYILYNELSSYSKASLLPYIRIKEEKAEIYGCVAINANKVAANLNDTQTQTALILRGLLKKGEISTEEASFNIEKAKTQNTVEISGKEAVFTHKVSLSLSLDQIADTFEDKNILIDKVQKNITQNANDLMALSKETECDFLMFKEKLYSQNSAVFNYIEDYEAKLLLSVNVKSHGQSKYEGIKNE